MDQKFVLTIIPSFTINNPHYIAMVVNGIYMAKRLFCLFSQVLNVFHRVHQGSRDAMQLVFLLRSGYGSKFNRLGAEDSGHL